MRGVLQRVGELCGSLLEEMEPLQHFGRQQHALLVEKLVALAHELALVGKLDHRAARRRHLTHAAALVTPAGCIVRSAHPTAAPVRSWAGGEAPPSPLPCSVPACAARFAGSDRA